MSDAPYTLAEVKQWAEDLRQIEELITGLANLSPDPSQLTHECQRALKLTVDTLPNADDPEQRERYLIGLLTTNITAMVWTQTRGRRKEQENTR